MKEIILLVDETLDQGALDVCSFYVFEKGFTYSFWMDDEWRVHVAIYADREDVKVNNPIWYHVMDPRDYSKYGDYTPDFIMEVIQGPSSFSGYDIPSKIVRETLLNYNSSEDKYIRTSTLEHDLESRMNQMIKEAIEEYKQELEDEAGTNK